MTLRTVLRCHAALGWTFKGSAYCQLICQQNKVKRLQWAQEHLSDGFDNVIWTNENGNHFVIVLLRTVRPFCLNGWGVSYNRKGCSVFISFCKNVSITLYCHIPYMLTITLKSTHYAHDVCLHTLHIHIIQYTHTL